MSARQLTFEEQKNVRTTLLVLKNKIGTWKPLARAMGFEAETLGKVAVGRRGVTPTLAFSVARFVDLTFDEVIAGKYLPTACCQYCGRAPDFNGDEQTVLDG